MYPLLLLASLVLVSAQTYTEQFRPQYLFTPAAHWINDPNGLLYYNGIYHMYYQYNPGGSTWGNISWGHATSTDLTHWHEQRIALLARGYPNNVSEYYFSGSAVADVNNTSGFGSNGRVPFVAMYTSAYVGDQVLPSGKTIRDGQQSQSIAYSLDEGLTWTTYDAVNPVIYEPPAQYADQYNNWRDPFVFWYPQRSEWVVVTSLANVHKLLIYTSPNLRNWTLASEFGPYNAVGGQWECPNLFPLPLDGNANNVKWIVQMGINPGGPTIGSATQYIVGSFDGTTFTPDPSSIYGNATIPANSQIFADFEGTSFSALGWTATGDFAGTGPAAGTIGGQQSVTGYLGTSLVNTFTNGDLSTGSLISPNFTITAGYINFLIGGGFNPYYASTYGTAADNATAMLLHVNGQIVRSATGQNGEALQWSGWDVSSYIGQPAFIEIVDRSTGGWGHINVDEISFSNNLAQPQQANWLDWGPDFYAAASFNGLPVYERIDVGWMNNWAYANVIPTSPWRSAMSIPRNLTLQTINGRETIVQQPEQGLYTLESATPQYQQSWASVPEGNTTLPITGKALDITVVFSIATATSSEATTTTPPGSRCNRDNCLRAFLRDPNYPNPSFCAAFTASRSSSTPATPTAITLPTYASACGSGSAQPSRLSSACSCLHPSPLPTSSTTPTTIHQFGIILRANSQLTQETLIGYDIHSQRLFVDRTRSGVISFSPAFPGVYYAPLAPSADGTVRMRILLDWSSVEVFGGVGESTITAQIFPEVDVGGRDVLLFSSGGAGGTRGVSVVAREVGSAWV